MASDADDEGSQSSATGLLSLPVELLQSIHIQSGSAYLPIVNRTLQTIFSSQHTTPHYRAIWLIHHLALTAKLHLPAISSLSASNIVPTIRRCAIKLQSYLTRALKFDVCTLDVLRIIEDRCRASLSSSLSTALRRYKSATPSSTLPPTAANILNVVVVEQAQFTDADGNGGRSSLTRISLESISLGRFSTRELLAQGGTSAKVLIPKRLFRMLPSLAPPHTAKTDWVHVAKPSLASDLERFANSSMPLLRYLLIDLRADPNHPNGYPLAKAVLARHFELLDLLLDSDADPSSRDNLPIMLAVGRGDLEIVRTLVEPDYVSPDAGERRDDAKDCVDSEGKGESTNSATPRKRRSTGRSTQSPGKRRRLEDRVKVTSAMLEAAAKQKHMALVDYFFERGAVPSMRTLAVLSQ